MLSRYEYKVIDTGGDIERQLNDLGADGWRRRRRDHEEAATDRAARRHHPDARSATSRCKSRVTSG